VSTDREDNLVELVGADGEALGAATVDAAHREPGLLHRAFSVFLRDDAGRLLLQRRAVTKTRFAGRWANACCGHPAPGMTVTDAAALRVREELGLDVPTLTPQGVYVYRAADVATGRVEHEYDHVLLAPMPVGGRLRPDPDEVDDVRWVTRTALETALVESPVDYAPWVAGALAVLPR
jgi:isopentenyl-diphosphate delta-isomerase